VLCVSACLCVRENRAELMKRRKPPPPKSCMGVYMDRLSIAIFSQSQLSKGCHFPTETIDLNSS
jgi:hypothetical protein